MEENLLSVGIKIEMTKPVNRVTDSSNQRNTTYVSQIMDMQDGMLTCAMPIYEGHLIPLETGSQYDVFFYSKKGIYKAGCKVISRGKEGNIYVCQIKLITSLEKFQRRQFFRLPCTLDIKLTPMKDTEVLYYLKNKKMPIELSGTSSKDMAVDISGGGLRVISGVQYNKGTYLALAFALNLSGKMLDYCVLGQVIQAIKSETNHQLYDHRVQFKEISKEIQEDIVKFIFEEQRRIRKREKGQ